MSEDWDDLPNQTPAPAPTAVKPKGRGFGAIKKLETVGFESTGNSGGSDWADGPTSSTTSAGDSWGGGGSWATGGSSGGTGNRSNECFKCHEVGHMSRECPKGGGDNRGRGCFNCGKEGHRANDCTEPKKERKPMACHNCGETGHMSRDCSAPKKPMHCDTCGRDGHTASRCRQGGNASSSGGGGGSSWANSGSKTETDWGGTSTNNNDSTPMDTDWGTSTTTSKSNDDTWGNTGGGGQSSSGNYGGGGGGGSRGCFNCGQEGHRASDCPEPKKERDGGKGCRNCGEDGHMARECTKEKVCNNCKKEGHMAKDCTEPSIGPDGKPRAPLYRPEGPKDDDTLYDSGISTGINFERYDKIKVNVNGINPPEPITLFEDAIKSQHLLGAIEKCKFKKPTPIQRYGIPIVLAGRDVMACAQTGSGKTLAFLLPIIQDFLADSKLPSLYGEEPQTPLCVVVSPTRELAIQINQEAFKLARDSIVKPQVAYGGTSVGHQIAQLSRGTHILTVTPGRLMDLVERGKVNFSNLKYLILDEADRMIDQGFLPVVRKMVSNSTMPDRTKRQTLMFSATFPDEVQRIANEFLKEDYLFLAVGIVGGANSDVEQTVMKVEKFEKRSMLESILGDCSIKDRTLIFVEQKKTADFLASFLSQSNYKATSIHGDRFQRQREEALFDFRAGRMPILVATSVASRGLDIKDVRHVINYDMPKEIDDYVHRIGRTGRVGNTGKATSFFDSSFDKDLAPALIKILQDAGQSVPDWLTEEGQSGYGGSASNGFSTDIRGGSGYVDMDNPGYAAAPAGNVDESWD